MFHLLIMIKINTNLYKKCEVWPCFNDSIGDFILMNQMLITTQRIRWLILIAIIGLLAFGYFLQYFEDLAPCPLCITQRFFFFLCGLTALIAIIHHPAQLMTRVYAIFGASFAFIGSGFAGRQLYLQSLPADQTPACGPSIEFIFDTFSISEALSILLRGDAVSYTHLRAHET